MPKILVIDDKKANLIALEALLDHMMPDCEVFTAQSGLDGINLIHKVMPDTILLDIQMPVMDGYEVCQRLKADERTKHIPIIFITAIETETESRIRGLEIGGDAFIVKPIQEEELLAQINVMLRIHKSRGELEAQKVNLEEREQEKTLALAESEERLKLLFNQTHDLITLCDANACPHWGNPAWLDIFGSCIESQKDLFNLIHTDDVQDVYQAWSNLLSGEKEINNLEYRLQMPNGAYRTVESSVHKAKVGGEEMFYIIAHDITSRKQSELALKLSEERYRTITENSPDVITRFDLQRRHVYVSPNIYTMTGKHADEYLGSTYRDMGYPDSVRIPIEEAINTTFVTGEQLELEYQFQPFNTNSPIFISLRLKPEFGPAGNVETVIGVSHNITERKRLEEQLRQAQKMEAIGTLAGGIAHDFNNILGVIMGYTEITLEDAQENSAQQQNLMQVLTAARRAEEMVKQILAFSRKSEEDKKAINIRHILAEALKMLRSTIPTTIDIHYEIGDNLGLVMAIPTQIHQVIVNLVTNAAYAMKEKGGLLEIILDQPYMGEESLSELNLAPGQYQRLIVRDSGHGMTPEIMGRIFEPYFTTKRPGEGTGMGLSVVHGIVKSHGGEINVSSEPFKGTTFQIFFPVTQEVIHLTDKESEPTKGGNEHILFVDDESSLAEMGKMMLEKLGYSVSIKTSSTEALNLFRESPHLYDLVITDQTMPHLTGTQLTRELLLIRPDLPVILSTGFSETVNKENFKTLGIRAFVMKPIVKREIAKIIRSVLEEN